MADVPLPEPVALPPLIINGKKSHTFGYTPEAMHAHAAAVTAAKDAEIAALRDQVFAEQRRALDFRDEAAALRAENGAIRDLMDCYNLGGWTDSLALIQERDALRAEVAGLLEASKSALLVLCALRDTLVCHPNMGKDIDFAIEATRAALAARKGTT